MSLTQQHHWLTCDEVLATDVGWPGPTVSSSLWTTWSHRSLLLPSFTLWGRKFIICVFCLICKSVFQAWCHRFSHFYSARCHLKGGVMYACSAMVHTRAIMLLNRWKERLIDQSAVHLIMSSTYRRTGHTNKTDRQQGGHVEAHDAQRRKLKKTTFQEIQLRNRNDEG